MRLKISLSLFLAMFCFVMANAQCQVFLKRISDGKLKKLIADIQMVVNPLMNSSALAESGGWFLVTASLGVLMIPVAWIDDGPAAAREVLTGMAVVVGASCVLFTPYLINKRYDLKKNWSIVVR
jgi:hypothetical protein